MSDDDNIKQMCFERGITRLCHFTSSRNLAHIVNGKVGILSTSKLETEDRRVFNSTDLKRLDGHKNHICCSVQYPNGWYFAKSRANEILFKDWVVLLISPHYLWAPETLFSPCNAATQWGNQLRSGFEGFKRLYESTVCSSRLLYRGDQHLPACPTDDQAEVLIADCISLADIASVVVKDKKQCINELSRLRILKLPFNFKFIIAPTFYDKFTLSKAIRVGQCPNEEVFKPGVLS